MTSDRERADEIIRMMDMEWEAFNASTLGGESIDDIPEVVPIRDAIEAALAVQRQEEREACAKVALRFLTVGNHGQAIAAAIRSRQTPTGSGETK